MISQTAEYALRAVVYLAENLEGGQTTEQIAKATQIPSAYLSKVLQSLGRTSIVQSQRGLGGGFVLKAKPKNLTVLDIVNAVDPIKRITECPLGLDAHAVKLCALHRRLDEASELVERAFKNTTIAEIMADPNANNVYTFPQGKTVKKTPKRKKS
jgi:Rrf2 family protein